MNGVPLKTEIRDRLWRAADRHPGVRSVTLTGSFADTRSLDGIDDIDCVVVVGRLNAATFDALVRDFDFALRHLLEDEGYEFRVNPAIGPVRLHGPRLAVLHLMPLSARAAVEYALRNPFPAFDWQRSAVYRRQPLADLFPVFGLQPRHFVGRRGLLDCLHDLRAGVVSYRGLAAGADGYADRPLGKAMDIRDRHECAFRVMRFLMTDVLKLVTRANAMPPPDELPKAFFARFPVGDGEFGPLFAGLLRRKRAHDFAEPVPDLEAKLEHFVRTLERQLGRVFHDTATRHAVFRHAPSRPGRGPADAAVFLGRSDEDALPVPAEAVAALAEAIRPLLPAAAFASPARRAKRTLDFLRAACILSPTATDRRLLEIDYGTLEGLTVSAARRQFPAVFRAWAAGDDPRPPGGGESVADVADRVAAFAADRWAGDANTVTCTHEVPLRCLLGATLGVPRGQWHRLRIPPLVPFTFVKTREFGLFVDVPAAHEREVFGSWAEAAEQCETVEDAA